MKTAASVLLLAASIASGLARGSEPVPLAGDLPTARQVWKTFEAWLSDYSKGNLPGVMAIFDSDVRFSFQGEKDQGYRELEASYVADFRSRKPGATWVPAVEEVCADGRMAIVRAVWELKVRNADGKIESRARNRSLDVLRRTADGQWRVFRSLNYPEPEKK